MYELDALGTVLPLLMRIVSPLIGGGGGIHRYFVVFVVVIEFALYTK